MVRGSLIDHRDKTLIGSFPVCLFICAQIQTDRLVYQLDFELNRTCHLITGRRGIFRQGVDMLGFPVRKVDTIFRNRNMMRIGVGYPCVDDVFIFITDGQRCAGQQGTACVHLVNIQYRCVLHDYGGVVQLFPRTTGLYMDLVFLFISNLYELKHNVFGFRIGFRSALFNKGVLLVQLQTAHGMRCLGRGPAFYQLAICLVDLQLGTGQLFAVGDILFGDVHRSAQIGVCAIHYLPCHFLPGIGELDFDGAVIKKIPSRGGDFDNAVFTAIAGVRIGFGANGHIHIKPSKTAVVGWVTGCQLCTGVHQLRAICCENIVHRVQFIHSTGQIGQCFAVLLIDANADFADLVIGLFGNRQHTRIFKDKDLCGLMGIRSIFNIDNAV